MTPFELETALAGMVCIVDTREQETPRLQARLRQMECTVEREKLNYGDYSAKFPLPDGAFYSLRDKVCVERKMSLDELCQCFCQSRARFTREFERAKQDGARLYLLIESATWENIYNGGYHSKMSTQALVASLLAFLARYDCLIMFCKPETTGRLIRDILYREGKERLETLEV